MKSRIQPSNAFRKVARRETRRYMIDEQEKFRRYFDVATLFALHEAFGFGAKRLYRFYKDFGRIHNEFVDWYGSELPDGAETSEEIREVEWIYHKKLKEIGVDVDKWFNELYKQE